MSISGFHIGSIRLANPLILAPLAGVTDLPFRLLAKEQGAALTVTEMVSARGLMEGGRRTLELLDTHPLEQPYCVQLFGSVPEYLARAAEIVQDMGAQIIDLNVGCPVKKVARQGAGAALLKDFPLLTRILKALRKACRVPLTVKTRVGWRPGEGDVLDLAPILAGEGVDAVTLHPRWAVQMFGGQADWTKAARLVEAFPGPVIGNGDITRPEDIPQKMAQTGVAGVMIGRAAMGNPWIFSQGLAVLDGRPYEPVSLDDRLAAALRHARLLADREGSKHAVFRLRTVLMWYSRGLPGATTFRRDVYRIKDFGELEARLEQYFETLARIGFTGEGFPEPEDPMGQADQTDSSAPAAVGLEGDLCAMEP
jgi:nifR3 family TIM-barrel protein